MGKVLVGVVLAVTAGAYADLHVVQQFNNNYSDSPQSASATVTVNGSASLSGSGTWYQWIGWPTNAWGATGIGFNNPTIALSPGAVGRASDPDGTGKVSFEVAMDALKQGTLDALSVDIKDGAAWALPSLNTLTLSSTSGRSVSLTLSPYGGAINSYGFAMTGGPTGSMTSYTVNSPGSPGGWDVIAGYAIAPYGTTSMSYGFSGYNAVLYLQDVGNVGIGQVLTDSDAGSAGMTLANGTMTLTELAGPYPKDVTVAIGGDLGAISLALNPSGGNYYYNNYSGGTNPYYIVSVNWGINGGATVSVGSHIALYDTIIDAIPEPVTLAVLGLGGALLTLARRRSR